MCRDLAFCLLDGVVFGRDKLFVEIGLGFDVGHVGFAPRAVQICLPDGLHLYWNLIYLPLEHVTLFEIADLLQEFFDLGPKGCIFQFNSIAAILVGSKH